MNVIVRYHITSLITKYLTSMHQYRLKISKLVFGVSLITIFFILPQSLSSQSAHKQLRTGDQLYQEKQYTQAEEAYRKAQESKKSLKGAYNLGNTLYKQNRYDEAIQQYDEAISKAKSQEELAKAYYNKGTALMGAQNYGESIEALKNALIQDPESLEAKQNLFIAKRLLQQQMQQQQQQQQEQQNQEQQQEQQQEEQQQEQEQQQEEEPQENQQNQEQQEQQEREREEKQDLDKKDAARLLEIVENEEKKVQEKMRRTSGKKTKTKKDW